MSVVVEMGAKRKVGLMYVALSSAAFLLLFIQHIVGVSGSVATEGYKLGKLETSNLSVMLVDVGKAASIAISPKADLKVSGLNKPDVSVAENPSRLIIDIPMSAAPEKTKKVALDHRVFSSMRLGTHPNKTRFVIDMKDDFSPTYTVTPVKKLGAFLVNFKLPTVIEQEQEQEQEEQVAVSEPPYARMRFAPDVIVTEKGIITHRGEQQESSKLETPEFPKIEEMYFLRSEIGELDSLSLKVDKGQSFLLEPTGDARYSLTLKKVALGISTDELQPGIGFKSLATHQDGENLVIDIAVKAGVQLAAELSEGILLLRATSGK